MPVTLMSRTSVARLLIAVMSQESQAMLISTHPFTSYRLATNVHGSSPMPHTAIRPSSRMVATVYVGGSWVSCHIAERIPNVDHSRHMVSAG